MNHLMVEAQGNLGGTTGLCELNISVSPGNINVSSEQVHLLKYLDAHAQDLELCRPAARIINETGISFSLVTPSDSVVTVGDQHELALQELLQPNQLLDIRRDGDSIDHVLVDKSDAAVQNLTTPDTFYASTNVIVFTSGIRLHMVSVMDCHFTQCVWVRTLVLVKNETTYRLIFTSDDSFGLRIVGCGAISCLPESLLDCKGLNLALSFDEDDSSISLKEPLWHSMSALDCVRLAYAQEAPPPSVAMEFISQKDASSHFVTLDFELTGNGGIIMFVHLSQPIVVNRTCFPVVVELFGTSSLSGHAILFKIDPGASASVCYLNPAISHPSRVIIDVNSSLYQSSRDLELCSLPQADGNTSVDFVVKHCKYPLRYFFELTATYEPRPYPGRKTTAWVISASSHAFIRNECEVDILILSTSSGTPTGSLPADGLRSRSGGQNLGYVPFNHGLRLKVQELLFSEEFEIIPNFAGACIQCESKESNGSAPVSHATYFLLRPIAHSEGRFFDIMPPMMIVNQHPSLPLYGCHMVRESDQTDDADDNGSVLVSTFQVDANTQKQYYGMAKDGYSSYFPVSFDNQTPHSFLNKTDLLPNTSWRGYMEYRDSLYCIDITRKGLYDPVTMVIGGPQPALLRVVNLTTVAFREVDALMVNSPSSSHPGDRELVLTHANDSGARLRISLLGDHDCADALDSSSTSFSVGVRTVVGDRDRPTIVLLFDPNVDIFVHKDVLILPEERQYLELRLEANIFRQCLNLRDKACVPMQLKLESLSIYIAYTRTLSVQCTATGLSIRNMCDGDQISVLEPFELNMTVRDATWSLCSVNVNSFHTSVSPINITISDWFVYQLQQFFEQCRLVLPEDSAAFIHDSCKAVPLLEQTGSLRYISADQATISAIPVEISWDRSVAPPTDYILGNSTLSLFIPSLHHARFVLPRVQFKKLITPSLNQLITTIQQLFLTEALKQLPQIVASVGFFKSDSSLIQRIGSGITSFFSWTSKQGSKTPHDASLL
ncbi:unnamed protein product [Phytomonas sp. Hart1]|nr:unnamed protein product [Phytomonas sp. Hart1]|eukprot:CCW72316.1 unnamed protein product [Phytomonas sp. isolate Hart1]